jgi:hypothetical protein
MPMYGSTLVSLCKLPLKKRPFISVYYLVEKL